MDKRVAILATKTELKAEKDKIANLEAFDSSYFRGKSNFENDGTQNYLVFQPIQRYFKKIGNTGHISAWKSNGLSDERIKSFDTCDNSLAPGIGYVGNKIRTKFLGSCLKQDKIIFTLTKTVNILIV